MSESKNMMLAKSRNDKKLRFPVYVLEKYDGVPIRMERDAPRTRQGELAHSVRWQWRDVYRLRKEGNPILQEFDIIGEEYINGEEFEIISGYVRREAQSRNLQLMLFDLIPTTDNAAGCVYSERRHLMDELLTSFEQDGITWMSPAACYKRTCSTADQIDAAYIWLGCHANKEGRRFEGTVIRPVDSLYVPQTRSFDLMRDVREPIIDLRLIDILPAKASLNSKRGYTLVCGVKYEPGSTIPAVGALVFESSNGVQMKCGPGTMKHEERVAVFENFKKYKGRIAKVKYKDSGYSVMRQPTFFAWHHDKTIPDIWEGTVE